MSHELPRGFDEWPKDAQESFVREARNKKEVAQLIFDELGLEHNVQHNSGHIKAAGMRAIYFEIRDNE